MNRQLNMFDQTLHYAFALNPINIKTPVPQTLNIKIPFLKLSRPSPPMSPSRPPLLAASILLFVPTRADSAGTPFSPRAKLALVLAMADPPTPSIANVTCLLQPPFPTTLQFL